MCGAIWDDGFDAMVAAVFSADRWSPRHRWRTEVRRYESQSNCCLQLQNRDAGRRRDQNENLAANWNWRGFSMVLGLPKLALGTGGAGTGPKLSGQVGGPVPVSNAMA